MAKNDNQLLYGQVPLPQVSKEQQERQTRRNALKAPPSLAAAIPQVSKEVAEATARKKELAAPPALVSPLPQGQKYRLFKVSWNGLNKTNEIDTGQLSAASNIDTGELPYIVPCVKMKEYMTGGERWFINSSDRTRFAPYPYVKPQGIWAYEDKLFVTYAASGTDDGTPRLAGTNIYIDMITLKKSGVTGEIYTGLVEEGGDDYIHSFMPFNVYDDTYAVINGNTYRRLIIAPYMRVTNMEFVYAGSATGGNISRLMDAEARRTGKIYIVARSESSRNDVFRYWQCAKGRYGYYDWEECTFTSNSYQSASSPMYERFFQPPLISTAPGLQYATVYGSRLFGVANGRAFASGFGDYANWELDDAEEYNESNAWVSPAQSNTKASTDFTGITAFRNHVVCFKKDFVHEIYNTKNPFRLVDVYSDGTIDQRSIQDVNGNLFFVSENNVLVYTGGTPRIIGRDLGIEYFSYAVAGSDNRRYYLYCEDAAENGYFYVYDTHTGTWTERAVDIAPNDGCHAVIGFAHNNRGMFMLGGDGRIYKLDTGEYDGEWTDTDNDGIDDTFTGVNWWLETELITRHNFTSSSTAAAMAYSNVNIKHIKKIQILADIVEGAELKVYALYDDEEFNPETSQLVYDSEGAHGRAVVRVKLRNTAHYGVKLHIEGKGYVKLYEIELYVENGGDLYLGE